MAAVSADMAGIATGLALLAKLLIAQGGVPRPEAVSISGDTLLCVAVPAREAHLGGRHLFACAEAATGEILGAVLTRAGVPVCRVTGSVDQAGCAVLVGCGHIGSNC